MQFIDMKAVAVSAPLKTAHYPLPRGEALKEALSLCMTDYYSKAVNNQKFEARGILVTGKSRVGKTRELDRLIASFNRSETPMPDGRSGAIISCSLAGKATWREAGNTALETLGYPAEGRRDAAYIWRTIRLQTQRLGVIGIHFDEAQHMFTDTGEAANRVMLDNFKALLKDPAWPLILILSGVPDLAKHLEKERPTEDRRQLRFLLTPIHFEMINPVEDAAELNEMAYSYADKAGVNFDALSNRDFFERLSHACAYRWGLVIEMLIEALTTCVLSGASTVTIEHFVEAFSKIYGTPVGRSPFTMPDYRDCFDPGKLAELLDRDR